MKILKNNHGGHRPGSGRKKSDIPGKTISFYVPVPLADELKKNIQFFIKSEIKKFRQSTKVR